MAYDENLAGRIREVLIKQEPIEEKKMFGGVGFLFQGNMVCGVHKDKMVVRVGPEVYDQMLMNPHVLPFDITGKPMRGWVLVTKPGWDKDEDLQEWVNRGFAFARTLPLK